MRTTIELSDSTYKRLRAEAAERGLRGLSPIVEEALGRLFDRSSTDTNEADNRFAAAEGTWSEADVEDWERMREEAWSMWRTRPSSTPTS